MSHVQLEVFVPVTHCDQVKAAIATAGGGRIGNYDSCMWQTLGLGQFRPLDGANPFIGQAGVVETVEEMKITCIVESSIIRDVITEMKKAHPYETPAFSYWPVQIS
jgi:hypothetical protein